MEVLASTTDSIVCLLGTAAAIQGRASFVDMGTATTPDAHSFLSAGSGAYDLVPAPASGTKRVVKSATIHNADSSLAADLVVYLNDNGDPHTLTRIVLQPGESLHYEDAKGWYVSPERGADAAAGPALLMARHFATANLTSAKTITSASTFAVYLGKTPRGFSTCSVRLRVTTAAATITWAEVAIAKGSVNVGGNPTLSVVGWADVSAIVNSLGQKTVTVNVASGQSVNANDDVWVLIGNSATTALQVRAQSIADDIQAGLQASLATRPSLNVGAAQAYTIEGATALAAWAAVIA